MSERKYKRDENPFGLTQFAIDRIQQFVDVNPKSVRDMASYWGITEEAAVRFVERTRERVGSQNERQFIVDMQRSCATTVIASQGCDCLISSGDHRSDHPNEQNH